MQSYRHEDLYQACLLWIIHALFVLDNYVTLIFGLLTTIACLLSLPTSVLIAQAVSFLKHGKTQKYRNIQSYRFISVKQQVNEPMRNSPVAPGTPGKPGSPV